MVVQHTYGVGLLIEERDETVTNDPTAVTRVWKVDFTRAQYVPTCRATPPGSSGRQVALHRRGADAHGEWPREREAGGQSGRTVLAMVDDDDFDLAHQVDPAASPTSLATQLDHLPLPRSCGL